MSLDVTQHPAGSPPAADPPRESWFRRHRRLIVIGTVVGLLSGGGAAYAWWSSTGEGTGTVDTGTAPSFVVSSTPGTGGPLTPDGPTETVAFTVANPSSGVLNLANVAVTVANADGSQWNSGTCTAADFTVGTPAVSYGEIAAGDDVSGTVTVQMINRPQNQDDCKNVTVPLYILAT